MDTLVNELRSQILRIIIHCHTLVKIVVHRKKRRGARGHLVAPTGAVCCSSPFVEDDGEVRDIRITAAQGDDEIEGSLIHAPRPRFPDCHRRAVIDSLCC